MLVLFYPWLVLSCATSAFGLQLQRRLEKGLEGLGPDSSQLLLGDPNLLSADQCAPLGDPLTTVVC